MEMKSYPLLFIVLLLLSQSACGPSVADLQKFVAVETYPDDTYLDQVAEKRALVIVAHDDDDCLMSGTIAQLQANGWEIKQLSLGVTRLETGRDTHPAAIICQGNELILPDQAYRNDLDTAQYPYAPIPKERFKQIFEREKVAASLIKRVNAFRPTVLFTMDNEIGGYGHPDHVFLSQLVLDLSQADSIHPARIYQGVYTDHMEREIIEIWLHERLKKWGFPNPYFLGKEVYEVSGMPEPNVAVSIADQAATKMQYLRAYHEDARKNMRKFIPYFEEFEAEEYFGVFDREFFRVIEL